MRIVEYIFSVPRMSTCYPFCILILILYSLKPLNFKLVMQVIIDTANFPTTIVAKEQGTTRY